MQNKVHHMYMCILEARRVSVGVSRKVKLVLNVSELFSSPLQEYLIALFFSGKMEERNVPQGVWKVNE